MAILLNYWSVSNPAQKHTRKRFANSYKQFETVMQQ